MDLQSLAYALTQVLHNFGAVAVLGGAVTARWLLYQKQELVKPIVWAVLLGWLIQGLSGAGFGAISYAYYGRFPDIAGVAVAALLIKMSCAVSGVVLAGGYLRYGACLSQGRVELLWNGLVALGVTALTSAAFLRWFS